MAKSKLTYDWQIRDIDHKYAPLNPPYPVAEDGLRIEGVGGRYSRQQRFGQQDDIVQWLGGMSKSYTFSTVLFSEDPTDIIKWKLEEFEMLAKVDDELGRPPICVFTYGTSIKELVMVESVDISIKPIRPPQQLVWIEDGKYVRGDEEIRLIELDLTLIKYKPFSQIQIDPTKPNKESYYLATSAAEANYEAIARRYYGSAIKGDRLRKRNPDMPMQPTVGEHVKIPAKDIVLKEEVKPEFHAFDTDNEAAVKNFNDLLNLRATIRTTIN